MLVSQQIDPAHQYEAVFTLGTQTPLYLWVSVCPARKCKCRAALAIVTDTGAEAAQRLGALVREARDEGSFEISARIGGVPHFFLNIDSGTIYWHCDGEWMDVGTQTRIKPVLSHLTGELLDELARLWRRARGQEENPESALLKKESFSIPGWEPGALISWHSLDVQLRSDVYEYDHQKRTYFALDKYCPNPRCTCAEVSITFLRARRRKTWESIGDVLIDLSGAPPRLKHTECDAEEFHELWDAFQLRHPDYQARLARRDGVMKAIGARFLEPARLAAHAAPKPARPSNAQIAAAVLHFAGEIGLDDPCPCGSGRKYKNCCSL